MCTDRARPRITDLEPARQRSKERTGPRPPPHTRTHTHTLPPPPPPPPHPPRPHTPYSRSPPHPPTFVSGRTDASERINIFDTQPVVCARIPVGIPSAVIVRRFGMRMTAGNGQRFKQSRHIKRVGN